MPLILFKRQLPDGRRIYDEILEGIKIENGKVKGNTIFKYEIKDNVYDDTGNIVKVIGVHKQINKMSENLLNRLKYGGASEEQLKRFI